MPRDAGATIFSHVDRMHGRPCAATKSMSDMVEERQQSRYAPFAAAPLRAAARRARWLCCSLLTYRPGYSPSLAPRQRAWGLQQNVNLFLREPLV